MNSNTNILIILTDQQRFDTLGCYGCDIVPTPNLDKLAKNGIVYENCYVNNPMCTPSRASIWTGKHLPDHGVYGLHDRLPESEALFTKYLQENGYRTGIFGKLHVSGRIFERDKRHPLDGFDVYEYALSPYHFDTGFHNYGEWLKSRDPHFYEKIDKKGTDIGHIPEDLHYNRWAVNRTLSFINEPHEKPFFCCVSLIDPHDPYDDHPISALQLVDDEKLQSKFRNSSRPPYLLPSGAQRESDNGYLGAARDYSEEQILAMRRSYYASVAFLDKELGRLFNSLEASGKHENTAVVFCSDHGDMLGQKNLLAKGAFFYDPCTKVPCIISAPNGPINRRVSSIVQPHDIAATVLQLSGYDEDWVSKRMPESRNLINTAMRESEDNSFKDDTFAICMYRNSGINDRKQYWDPPIHGTMLRTSRYKLTLYHDSPDVKKIVDGELFDLLEDPGEQNNLYGDSSMMRVQSTLIQKIQKWLEEHNSENSGGRGGTRFPPRAEWRKNNPIRTV